MEGASPFIALLGGRRREEGRDKCRSHMVQEATYLAFLALAAKSQDAIAKVKKRPQVRTQGLVVEGVFQKMEEEEEGFK